MENWAVFLIVIWRQDYLKCVHPWCHAALKCQQTALRRSIPVLLICTAHWLVRNGVNPVSKVIKWVYVLFKAPRCPALQEKKKICSLKYCKVLWIKAFAELAKLAKWTDVILLGFEKFLKGFLSRSFWLTAVLLADRVVGCNETSKMYLSIYSVIITRIQNEKTWIFFFLLSKGFRDV